MNIVLLSVGCSLVAAFLYDLFVSKHTPSIRNRLSREQSRLAVWIKSKIFISAIRRNSESSELWTIGIGWLAAVVFFAGTIWSQQRQAGELVERAKHEGRVVHRHDSGQSLQELETLDASIRADAVEIEIILWTFVVLFGFVWMPYALMRREVWFQINRLMARLATIAGREEYIAIVHRELAVHDRETLDDFTKEINGLLQKYEI